MEVHNTTSYEHLIPDLLLILDKCKMIGDLEQILTCIKSRLSTAEYNKNSAIITNLERNIHGFGNYDLTLTDKQIARVKLDLRGTAFGRKRWDKNIARSTNSLSMNHRSVRWLIESLQSAHNVTMVEFRVKTYYEEVIKNTRCS